MTSILKVPAYFFIIISLLSAEPVQAIENNLKIGGNLVSEPCTLDPDKSTQVVDFKSVISEALYRHTRTNPVPFTVALKDCDVSLGKTVTIKFVGTESKILPGLLATEGYSGIAIGIEQVDSTPLLFNKETPAYELENGINTIKLQAFVQAEPDSISNKTLQPGSFSATAMIEVAYP